MFFYGIERTTTGTTPHPFGRCFAAFIAKKYGFEMSMWSDMFYGLMFKENRTEKEEEILRHDKFLEFNLSGHTEGKRFRPWQMVDDKRM